MSVPSVDPRGDAVGAAASGDSLRVEVEFAGLDGDQAQAVAAQMIARAHQLANRPEFECDVDVSVQLIARGGSAIALERADEPILAPVADPDEHRDALMAADAARGASGERPATL